MGNKIELSKEAVGWLANGERGISSNVMFGAVFGFDVNGPGFSGSKITPADPDDFKRCWLLWIKVPEIGRNMDKISKVSKQWGLIIENWDKLREMYICAISKRNKGEKRPFLEMYNFMKELRDSEMS